MDLRCIFWFLYQDRHRIHPWQGSFGFFLENHLHIQRHIYPMDSIGTILVSLFVSYSTLPERLTLSIKEKVLTFRVIANLSGHC